MSIFEAALSNALVATLLAALAFALARTWNRPALVRAIWLLVFVKLITPPLAPVSCPVLSTAIGFWDAESCTTERSVTGPHGHEFAVCCPPEPRSPTTLPPARAFAEKAIRDEVPVTSPALGRATVWLAADAFGENPDHSQGGVGPRNRLGEGGEIQPVWRVPIELTLADGKSTSHAPTHPDVRAMAQERGSAVKDTLTRPVADTRPSVTWLRSIHSWSRQQWLNLAGGVWLFGSLLYFIHTAIRLWRFRRIVALAKPPPEALARRARRVSARLQLHRAPRVLLLPAAVTPMIWAPWRAYLLIPEKLVDRLSGSQLDSLFAHEMAHLRSRDHWVRWLELAVSVGYWWHPVVWLAKRGIREAEERICDAWVVATLPGIATTYAAALVKTISFLSGSKPNLPPAALGLSHFRSLKGRITMIMHGGPSPRLSLAGWLAILSIAVFLMPVAPTLASRPPREANAKPDAEITVTLVDHEADSQRADEDDGDDRDDEVDDENEADAYRDDEHDWDEDEEAEADEAVEEIVVEIRETIHEMDEEIAEAVEEAEERLREVVEEAPKVTLRAMGVIDIEEIVVEAIETAPEAVRLFVTEVDPAAVIEGQLAEVTVELREIEVEEKEVVRVRRQIRESIQRHVDQLSSRTRKEIDNIRREIVRETRQSPARVREILGGMNFNEIVKDAAADTSPIVQRLVEEIDVQDMVRRGLAGRGKNKVGEGRGRAEGRARAGRSERPRSESRARGRAESRERSRRAAASREKRSGAGRSRADAPPGAERYDRLERRLDRLALELELLRREMRELRDDGNDDRRGQ